MPSFTFALSPTDVAECQDVRIYWTAANVQGFVFSLYFALNNSFTLPHRTPSFLSVIPDGAFGSIPLGRIDTQTGLGTGFTWRPPVTASTNLIIVGSDNRGTGSGGFISNIVSPGNPNRDAAGNCPAPTATRSTSAVPTSTSTLTSYVSFHFFFLPFSLKFVCLLIFNIDRHVQVPPGLLHPRQLLLPMLVSLSVGSSAVSPYLASFSSSSILSFEENLNLQ